jgi:hypothetical protein
MSNWFNGLMGKASTPTQGLSVSTLLDRVQNATTSEDRRKAIADLRTLADNPAHIKAIGTEGIPVLMKRLRNERTDVDGARGIIQLLISIMSISGSELRTAPLGSPQYENVTLFVKDPSNSALILSLLEEKDRNIRYFSTKLLTYLLANKGSEIEAAVLQSPAHITRLMDLLKLGSEMIRNEALLLLIEISKTNVELQKVIAYESGFENLLDIIESEGLSNGGIVVQDCLLLIMNLLVGNTSNQNHFREMGCAPRLAELLSIEASDHWIMSEDKKDNILLTMDAICALLSSPSSVPVTSEMVKTSLSQTSSKLPITAFIKPSSSIQATQTHLGTTSVLERAVRVVMSAIKTPGIRTKARWLLGDLVFCHPANSAYLEKQDFKDAVGTGRISALLQNTILLFYSKVPTEALAALHLFKCYCHENAGAQRLFAATIAPPGSAKTGVGVSSSGALGSLGGAPVMSGGSGMSGGSSVGDLEALKHDPYPARIIVGHLLAWETHTDSIKTFYAAMALAHILSGNNGVKEQLLKLPFEAPIAGVPIENLLSKLIKWLFKALQIHSELPVVVALLRCIATWVEDCSLAVNHFRSNPAHVTFLTNLLASPAADVHIGGLAAYLYALIRDPTTGDGALPFENSAQLLARFDALRKTPEFAAAERGGPRTAEQEVQLPFYDATFALSFLKQMNILSQVQPLNTQTNSSQETPSVVAPMTTTHVVVSASHPSTIVRPQISDPSSSSSALFDPSHSDPHANRIGNGIVAQSNPQTTQISHLNQGNQSTPAPYANGHSHAHHPHSSTTKPHQNGNIGDKLVTSPGGSTELEELRRQLSILQQEKQAWIYEKTSLETQLQHAQAHVNHLQTQLQTASRQNEQISAQLSSSASVQVADYGLRTQYEKLQVEHEELNAAHEDLLILLAETQDELASLRGSAQPHEQADDIL